MKVALALSAFTAKEPASSIRNNDQGPLRSRMDGAPVSLLTEIAVRGDAPGQSTVVGGLLCDCGGGGGGCGCPPPNIDDAVGGPGVVGLAIVVPPISVFTVTPGPDAPGGRIANDTAGTLPPV